MNRLKKIPIPKYIGLLPAPEQKNPDAKICCHCDYVNENEYAFCTNCGFPCNDSLVTEYHQKLRERHQLLFKAEYAVGVARIVLYIMASFILLGIFVLFTESEIKYFIAMLAIIMSALFFFLAFWSKSNPFSAMLTSFIILITLSAINIFSKFSQPSATSQGLLSLLFCVALLLVVMRGVKGAYRVSLMKQELQTKL